MINKLLLCTPSYYDIEYCINPWMDLNNRVNKKKAWMEWERLIQTFKSLNVEISTIEGQPNLPDMTFAGDCGMFLDGTFLASNFKHQERKPERDHYVKWMRDNGYSVAEIPSDIVFEGLGDVIYDGAKIVFGHGPRSSAVSLDYIRKTFPQIEVLAEVEIKDDAFFHLAMAAGLLNDKTIIYYPPAFTEKSIEVIKKTFPNAIAVGEQDAREYFVCNNVPIGNKVIMDNCTTDLEKKLNELNFEVVKCDVGEFKKSGASLRCLVLSL